MNLWAPSTLSAPTPFAFDAMHVASGALTIKLALEFLSLPLMIKLINESHRLASLALFPDPRAGSLYGATNSRLLEAFNDRPQHLAIVADEWIDLFVAGLA